MKTSARASMIALIGVWYFSFAAVLLHLIRTDLDPVATYLSIYALGQAGPLLSAGFFAIGLSMMHTSIQLSRTTKTFRNMGSNLLFVSAIGAWMVALYKVGSIHNIGALLVFMFFPPGVLWIGVRQKEGVERRLSLTFGIVTLIFFVLLLLILVFGDPLDMSGIGGLVQKIDIGAITLWLGLIAWRNFRAAHD